jgi:hypothetical protein
VLSFFKRFRAVSRTSLSASFLMTPLSTAGLRSARTAFFLIFGSDHAILGRKRSLNFIFRRLLFDHFQLPLQMTILSSKGWIFLRLLGYLHVDTVEKQTCGGPHSSIHAKTTAANVTSDG